MLVFSTKLVHALVIPYATNVAYLPSILYCSVIYVYILPCYTLSLFAQ